MQSLCLFMFSGLSSLFVISSTFKLSFIKCSHCIPSFLLSQIIIQPDVLNGLKWFSLGKKRMIKKIVGKIE